MLIKIQTMLKLCYIVALKKTTNVLRKEQPPDSESKREVKDIVQRFDSTTFGHSRRASVFQR